MIWTPGEDHPQYSNVVAGATEGRWQPAPGYRWVSNEAGDLRVVPATGTDQTGTGSPAVSSAGSLSGVWLSDWGPVTLNVSGGSVTGSWDQGSGRIGRILSGSFDPQKRVLVFNYFQDWNKQNGTTSLTLSSDGTQLSGSWTQTDGSGNWTLTRKPRAAPGNLSLPHPRRRVT